MDLIEWKEDFSVQIREIDEQHKQLIKYINDVNEALLSGDCKDIIGKTLDGLLDYTVTHFGTEEKYFDMFNYEESERHKQEHQIFTSIIMKTKKAFDDGDKTVPLELLAILYNWFVDHIIKSDRKYIPCFLQNGLR